MKIRARWWILLAIIHTPLLVLGVLVWELMSSDIQARYLAKTASKMTWRMHQGPSEGIRFPANGPYDVRLGYSKLPESTQRLAGRGWDVDRQAKISIQMQRAHDLGLNLPYREKNQGGLTLLDDSGKALYLNRYPERVYADFADTPPVLRNALLFIENRELLTEKFPSKNPAVEWDRLGQAVLDKFYSMIKRWILDGLAARRDSLDDPLRWCERMLREEAKSLSLRELETKSFMREVELTPLVEQLIASGRVVRLPGKGLVHADTLGACAGKIIASIDRFHAANPQRAGTTREELVGIAGVAADLFEPAIESLVQSGQLQNAQSVFARAGWIARLSDRDTRLCGEIENAFLKAGYAGPTEAELATLPFCCRS